MKGRDPVVLMYAGHGPAVKPPLSKDEFAALTGPMKYPSVADDEPGAETLTLKRMNVPVDPARPVTFVVDAGVPITSTDGDAFVEPARG